ncbi:aspartate--tRNA ligase msd1, partial [Tieghemiomyces parasiticus]
MGFLSEVRLGRSHTCGELRTSDIDKTVRLCGWVQYVRKATSDLLFLGIRDKHGVTQAVYQVSDPSTTPTSGTVTPEQFQEILRLAPESVLYITGKVTRRPDFMVNKSMSTGEVEVTVNTAKVLNVARNLPFAPDDTRDLPKEEIRLKHRHVDLRRPSLQNNLALRSQICHTVRKFLIDDEKFMEVETPILFKSTPEGAREYLVPTRARNRFFALPQSPQQFKQLLMVGGVDKYFQIARCFRDEDARSDRQPEFTQIDLEMSFVTERHVMDLVERMVQRIWQAVRGVNILAAGPLPRITYQDAIAKYGSDKPDVRLGME